MTGAEAGLELDRAGVLRVLTWNIKDHCGDPDALYRVLRACDADVVCLQEAYRRPWPRSRLPALAREVGLLHLVGGASSAGTALLVGMRTVVRKPVARRLPVRGLRTRSRGVAAATVGLLGHRPVHVASIHLGLDADERRRHVDLLLASLPEGPLVVAGDLNERPGGPSWEQLRRRVEDVGTDGPPTYSAAGPRSRIDAVLVSPDVHVTFYGSPPAAAETDVVAASDHRPVLAEIVLPPA